jgi:hypothetical protein
MRVELINQNGEVISFSSDELPSHPSRRVGSRRAPTTLVVKFPLQEVKVARWIRLKVTQRAEEP